MITAIATRADQKTSTTATTSPTAAPAFSATVNMASMDTVRFGKTSKELELKGPVKKEKRKRTSKKPIPVATSRLVETNDGKTDAILAINNKELKRNPKLRHQLGIKRTRKKHTPIVSATPDSRSPIFVNIEELSDNKNVQAAFKKLKPVRRKFFPTTADKVAIIGDKANVTFDEASAGFGNGLFTLLTKGANVIKKGATLVDENLVKPTIASINHLAGKTTLLPATVTTKKQNGAPYALPVLGIGTMMLATACGDNPNPCEIGSGLEGCPPDSVISPVDTTVVPVDTTHAPHSSGYPLTIEDYARDDISDSGLADGYSTSGGMPPANDYGNNATIANEAVRSKVITNVATQLDHQGINNPTTFARGIATDTKLQNVVNNDPLMMQQLIAGQSHLSEMSKEAGELILDKLENDNMVLLWEGDQLGNKTYNISTGGNLAQTYRGAGPNGEDVLVFKPIFQKTSGVNFYPTLINEMLEAEAPSPVTGRSGQDSQLVLGDLYQLSNSAGFPEVVRDGTPLGNVENNEMVGIYHNGAFNTDTIENTLGGKYYNDGLALSPPAGQYGHINTYIENVSATNPSHPNVSHQNYGSFGKALYNTFVGHQPHNGGYNTQSLNDAIGAVHHFFDDKKFCIPFNKNLQ